MPTNAVNINFGVGFGLVWFVLFHGRCPFEMIPRVVPVASLGGAKHPGLAGGSGVAAALGKTAIWGPLEA